MIGKLEISGVHTHVDDRLRKYAIQKIGGLDHHLPRYTRPSIHAEIKLKEMKSKDKNRYTCVVILHLPHEVIRLEERTINLYAAVDIIEEKLNRRMQKYKSVHATPKFHRRILARFGRQTT